MIFKYFDNVQNFERVPFWTTARWSKIVPLKDYQHAVAALFVHLLNKPIVKDIIEPAIKFLNKGLYNEAVRVTFLTSSETSRCPNKI